MGKVQYNVHQPPKGSIIKMWTKGVPVEEQALKQLENVASMPFIHGHVAVMPDVHWGMGATIGSVIPTLKAIIPAAVGVDLGCGMMAVKTDISASWLPDNLGRLRSKIQQNVPHGRTIAKKIKDEGSWDRLNIPENVVDTWVKHLNDDFGRLVELYPSFDSANHISHLGTLGTGNHFIEVCLDENDDVWFMLHSGSRGIGNKIGRHYIEKAKKEMERWFIHLPDKDLAYLVEGSEHFKPYVDAVSWAQKFAKFNREIMMDAVFKAAREALNIPLEIREVVVNCHHNYISREQHLGRSVWVTRKGAVRARVSDLGIIPGSMGAKSFIVKGKGDKNSFHSCSHGAGRAMSRTAAKKKFTLEDHKKATEGVECRKDEDVIDETPGAYKSIDAVMAAQSDLVEIVHTLRQVVCVKG